MNTKKSIILYLIILFILTAIAFFQMEVIENIASLLLWVLGVILIFVVILNGYAKIFPHLPQNKQAAKALDALNQCDPKASIALHTQWYGNLQKKRFVRRNLLICVNNLAVSYQEDGDFSRAISLLEGITSKARTQQEDILIHGNLAAIYLETGYPAEFLREMEIVNVHMQTLIEKSKMHQSFQVFVDNVNMQYAIYEGKYEKPLAFFNNSFITSTDLRSKCHSMYKQACIYEKLGYSEKQAECLKYVEENGKDLYIARTARDKLANLVSKD